jgi:hypothetical protein
MAQPVHKVMRVRAEAWGQGSAGGCTDHAGVSLRLTGPLLPAGYSSKGTASARQARSTGSTIRHVSTASSPRTDKVGSPSSTPASTSP